MCIAEYGRKAGNILGKDFHAKWFFKNVTWHFNELWHLKTMFIGAAHSTKMQEPWQILKPSLVKTRLRYPRVENEETTFALGKERILVILWVTSTDPMPPMEGARIFTFQAEMWLSSPRATAEPRR